MPINSPVPFSPVRPPRGPMDYANQTRDVLSSVIPGLQPLTNQATANVQQELSGLPNPGIAQRANAYYGIGSGMPGSDFVRNRGVDLYGQQAEQYKARGFNDFLNLLKGVSGTIAPTPSEQENANQFDLKLQQQQMEGNTQTMGSNARMGNDFDTNAWSSNDSGDLYNRSGQKIRNDPNFRNPRSILF